MTTPAWSRALYFPHIDIADDAFLKTNVLFWDEIHTIVPERVSIPYEHETSRALADAKILRPLYFDPESDRVSRLGSDLAEFLQTKAGAYMLADTQMSDIHPEKIPYMLRSFIADAKKDPRILASVAGSRASEDRVDVPQAFYDYYMSAIAAMCASDAGLGVLSESQPQIVASEDERTGIRGVLMDDQPLARAQGRVEQGLLAQAVLQSFSIHPANDVNVILDFRRSHRDELRKWRQHVAEVGGAVARETTPAARQRRFEDAYDLLMSDYVQLREQVDGAGLRFGRDVFIALADLGVALKQEPKDLDAWKNIGDAAFQVVVAPFNYSVDSRSALRNSPASFLYAVSEELTYPKIDLTPYLAQYR